MEVFNFSVYNSRGSENGMESDDNNNNVFQKCNWFAQSSSLSFVFKNSKDENEVSLCNNCPKKRGNSH